MLDHLNPEQKEAVLHKEGPSVVFAGAGSGKTRVITTRIVHLIEKGTPPQNILAVTFTNKAAKEMRERLRVLSQDAYRVNVGTFHSSCARWLREFASELGFSSDFTIYDDKDSIQALKSVLKEFAQTSEDHTPKDYLRFIVRAKTYACLPFEVESTLGHEAKTFPPLAIKVYEKYQNYLANCNAMDFSDLLMNMLILLRNNKLVRQTLQNRFRYILIDEYQDTNLTQFDLINLMVNEKQNLFVVGDDDQSIYSWRGANPHNIIDFKNYYPKAKIFRLEQNYRSSANIVDAASALIKHNKTRAPKTLWTRKDHGEIIEYKNEYDSETEAWFVADSILAEKSKYSYDNIAVLYRTNAQSRQIEDVLRKQKIPYRIYGSLRFYDRAEIKDLLAYCRLIANPDDDIAFRRSLNMPPRGIGKKTIETIEEQARKQDCSLFQAAQQMVTAKKEKAAIKVSVFLEIIKEIKIFLQHNPLEDFLVFLLEKCNYRAYLEKKYPELLQDKIANIHELGSAISEFANENKKAQLIDWLKEVALIDNERSENGFADEEEQEAVQLMTLHATKGLEFLKVYILGVEDGLIPHTNSMDDPNSLEEERRLLYVGMTRAQKKLYLLTAERRRVLNNWVSFVPSRFLSEIPPKYFGLDTTKEKKNPHECKSIKIGTKIYHQTFKSGIVRNIQKVHHIYQAVVDFEDFGLRKVDLNKIKMASTKDFSQELTYDYNL